MVNEDIKSIHSSKQISSKEIVRFLNEYPNLELITCPKSIYNRIPKKYFEALNSMGIEIEIKNNWGTIKYDEKICKNVVRLFKKDKTAKEIAKILNIPLKTVYYLNSKCSDKSSTENIRKRKFHNDFIEKVQKYKFEGLKAKEIAKKENIPIRTVYYLNSIKLN
ncbi:MAG: hypothetical protein LBM96_13155 [Methanobrevibacter sp.]|nr:hypothetical protein [Candidatus Methanoflexus mossambicus]